MSDEFKCGACKEVFNQFIKFFEHKEQCSAVPVPVNAGTTPPTMTILTIPQSLTVLTQFNNHHNHNHNGNTVAIPPMLHHQQQQQQQLQVQPQQQLVVAAPVDNYNGIKNECIESTFVPWISSQIPLSTSSFVHDVKSDIKPLIYTDNSPTIHHQNNPVEFVQNTGEIKFSTQLSTETKTSSTSSTTITTIAPQQHIIENKKQTCDLLVTMDEKTMQTAVAPTTPTIPMIKVKRIRTRKKASELDRTYQCKICGRSFRLNKIKDHMQIHMVWPDTLEANIGTGNFDELAGNYRCNHCPERIETFKKLRTHMHTLHKNVKLYMCPMSACHQLFGFEDLIIEHSKGCSFKSNVQCPICYQYFSLKRELEIHLIEHRTEILKNMTTTTAAEEQSNLHTATTNTTTVLPTNTNIIQTKSNIIVKTLQSEIILPEPSSSSVSVSAAMDAQLTTALHPNQCPVCLVKYKSHASMLKHLHKDTHSHECQMCPKVFKNRRALTMHLHIHRDLRCICQICNRSFKMPKMLKAHLLTHIERGYICDICGVVTSLKYNLLKHFRRHTNPMSMCKVNGCKRVFRRTDCLKAHRKTHRKVTTKCKDKRKKTIQKSNDSNNGNFIPSFDNFRETNEKKIINTESNNNIDNKKLTDTKPSENFKILSHFKRSINFKKNVVIPGIVIKGDKITEGYEILKQYKENTAKNDQKMFSDDHLQIKNQTAIKQIKCEAEHHQNNNNNNNFIDICNDMEKKFEFVECNSFHNNNNNNNNNNCIMVSITIEKLPDHITNYYMKKMETFEGGSDPHIEREYMNEIQLISSRALRSTVGYLSTEFVDVRKRRRSKTINNEIEIPRTTSDILKSELNLHDYDDDDDGGGFVKVEEVSVNDYDDDNDHAKPFIEPSFPIKKKRQYIMKNRKKKVKIVEKKNSSAYGEKLKESNKITKLPAAVSAWPVKRLHLFVKRLTKKTKTTPKTFECKICGRHFKANSVHNHLQSHCVWPFTKSTHIGNSTFDGTEKIYRCPYCPETFIVHAPLRSHMAQTHFSEKVFICPLEKCRRLFNVDLEFLQHCTECVFRSTLRCPVCHRFFSHSQELKTHKTIAHEIVDNSDVDDVDNNSDINQNNKLDNKKSDEITKLKVYECTVCHTKFKNKILLTKHMTRDSHNHQCIYCGKQFLRLTCVQNHILTHRESPKMCYICGKIFKTRTSLHLHMIGHTKCFTCDICEKMFARKKELINHIKSHNAPLYGCTHPGCKVVYRRKELILRHLKKNDVAEVAHHHHHHHL